MSRRSAFLAVVAFVAATAGGVHGTATPALAAETCDGVWVVVDARTAGGSLTTRCSSGDPSSGIRALTGVGHDVAYVPNQPGLVCTIDARPDPCNGAPSDAFWSYWYASAGGSWTYSNQGAGSRDPAPGTVEGWRFGDGSAPPGTAPPSNAAPESEPEPDPEPEPEPEPDPPSSSSGAGSSSDTPTDDAAASTSDSPDGSGRTAGSDQTDADTEPREADDPEGPEDEPSGSDEPSGADDPAGPEDEPSGTDRADARETSAPEALDGQAAGQASTSSDADGSPWGPILAVGLVGAIGGATLHRRRRPGQQRPPRRAVG